MQHRDWAGDVITKFTWEPIDPEFGDLMTIQEFIECVKDGTFIDYDGFGNYATATHVSNAYLQPSDIKDKGFDVLNFTHVLWYNR